MGTKVATAIAKGDAASAADALIRQMHAEFGEGPSARKPALLALFASTAQPLDELAPLVAAAFPGTVLVGASTAGELTERGDARASAVLCGVAGDLRVHAGLGTGLRADPERAVAQALAAVPLEVAGYPHRTAILLLDPLAGNGEEATLILASVMGATARIAGGAAGDDLAMRRTVVACGGSVADDAVVVAMLFSRSPLGLGSSHAHTPLSRSLRVTRARGNVVHEIEGRPAWSVWLDETREAARLRGVDVDALPRDREGAHLLLYEAGLAAGASGYTIRAPLSRSDDGSISFACGVPEGSVIRITESTAARQAESAREAARLALSGLDSPCAGALVFDCICRGLILGDGFGLAVRGMAEELGGAPLAGFETYGEIALDAGDMNGFHNTTSVVLAFPAD